MDDLFHGKSYSWMVSFMENPRVKLFTRSGANDLDVPIIPIGHRFPTSSFKDTLPSGRFPNHGVPQWMRSDPSSGAVQIVQDAAHWDALNKAMRENFEEPKMVGDFGC